MNTRAVAVSTWVVSVLFTAIAMNPSAQAQDLSVAESATFWNNIKTLVGQCAVRPYTLEAGKKVYGKLRSTCVNLSVKGAQAAFTLPGSDAQQFTATIEESQYADGGDLDNITITDSTGKVLAERENVAAFGDVLLALAGGEVPSPDLYVATAADLAE